MFEHVGEARLPDYFRRAFGLLKPGGSMLNHGIARRLAPRPRRRSNRSFSQRYVFPDGELLPISTTLRVAEECGFEVRDLESLREHYALTLGCWLRRLESNRDLALRLVNEPTYRVWRLFIAMSIRGFQTGDGNLYQALLMKADRGLSRLPLSRADWYLSEGTRERLPG
jgi:cyclopropane-fatty-acyl-phospholipid synthase